MNERTGQTSFVSEEEQCSKGTAGSFFGRNKWQGRNKTVAIACAVVVFVVVFVAAFMVFNAPSAVEKQVEEDARELKSMMKNPESLTIRGDITVVNRVLNDGSTSIIVAIDHSGENSYGGTSRSTALFSNGEYVGDYEDEIDVDGYSSDEEIGQAISLSATKLQLLMADSEEYEYVDGAKIAKALDVQYSE